MQEASSSTAKRLSNSTIVPVFGKTLVIFIGGTAFDEVLRAFDSAKSTHQPLDCRPFKLSTYSTARQAVLIAVGRTRPSGLWPLPKIAKVLDPKNLNFHGDPVI